MTKTRHNRQSIRLKEYDYTQSGAYFVTICTHKHGCLFGSVTEGEIQLNQSGQIAQNEWLKSSKIRQEIEMDAFVIMPNHLHGIVFIHKNDAEIGQPTGSLSFSGLSFRRAYGEEKSSPFSGHSSSNLEDFSLRSK